MTGRRIQSVAMAASALTAATSAVVAVAGFVLLDRYRPTSAEAWTLPGPLRSSSGWVRWHDRFTVGTAVLSVVTLVIAAFATRLADDRRTRRGGVLGVAGAITAAAAAGVVLATRASVRWEQLGLWAVAVGDDVSGYGLAAFDDGVRFVIVDGMEVSPGDYRVPLLLHLGAPVVACVGAVVALAAIARARAAGPADPPAGIGPGVRSELGPAR